jgi:hypothetical protein
VHIPIWIQSGFLIGQNNANQLKTARDLIGQKPAKSFGIWIFWIVLENDENHRKSLNLVNLHEIADRDVDEYVPEYVQDTHKLVAMIGVNRIFWKMEIFNDTLEGKAEKEVWSLD